MTHQPSFSQAEFADKKKVTRREKFLTRMEALIPWAKLLAVIEPFYPKGQRGRPPIGLERMLRVYFLQQWYGLADEVLEDALYDSQAMQGFARIDLAAEGVPDATTLLKFRRLLPAFAFVIPVKTKLLELGPDFLHGRHVEFQPDPFVDHLGLAPNLRQFGFQFVQQGKRIGCACRICSHGYSLSCRPPVVSGLLLVLVILNRKRGRHFGENGEVRSSFSEKNKFQWSIIPENKKPRSDESKGAVNQKANSRFLALIADDPQTWQQGRLRRRQAIPPVPPWWRRGRDWAWLPWDRPGNG